MFILEFKTSNAAHRDPDGEVDLQQVADTVSEVKEALEEGVYEGKVYDYNGNTIGHFLVTD